MVELDAKQKAERIAALFRERRQIDILPPELMPADLDEAYAIRAGIRGDRDRARARRRRRLQDRADDADHAAAVRRRRAVLRRDLRDARCITAAPSLPPAIIAGSASRPRSRCGSARTCRRAATATGSPPRSKAAWRRSRCWKICGTTISGSAPPRWSPAMCGMPARSLGAPVTDWRRLDLAQATARLTINGREIGRGKGGDVMGNPLNALAWLANKLAAAGTPLQARHGRADRQHGADPVPGAGRPRGRRGRGARHRRTGVAT